MDRRRTLRSRRHVSLGIGLLVLCGARLSAATAEEPRLPRLEDLPRPPGRFSIEAAYEAIPHRRTVFRLDRSPIAEPEMSYLRVMFALIDQAIVARVSAYQSFYYGGRDRRELLEGISALSRFLETEVTPPRGLETYHSRIKSALEHQKAFFSDWLREGEGFAYRDPHRLSQNPRVQGSSRALVEAYGILMTRYGAREGRENQNAFFDYHCALDFL